MPLANQTDTDARLCSVQASAEQFSRTIGIARSLVAAGQLVDLCGLDGEMGFVCARALDLPPDQGRILRPSLISLRDELDALASALAARPPPEA